MKDYISNGFAPEFRPVSDEQRLKDNEKAIARGNHKSAMDNIEVLRDQVLSEIHLGFQFPFDKDIINKINHAVVAPYGMAIQWTFNELKERILKYRPTHDLSMEQSLGNSLNMRLIRETLPELYYGWCFSRLLHFTHALRSDQPRRSILIGKIDVKSACRRCTLRALLAAMSITTLDDYAILILRQTFGGAFGPFDFTDIVSEPATDLANDLLSCEDWKEDEIFSLHVELIPPPELLSKDMPFGKARTADVVVPVSKYGKADDFIDDIISVGYFSKRWKRLAGASLLSLHILGRPVSKNEPLPRDDLVAMKKLQAEGRLSEKQTVLGWDIDTRRFTASLPDLKFVDWCSQIEDILNRKYTTKAELDSLIGRLNHAAMVIPLARHFLGRLRHLASKASRRKQRLYLSSAIIHDLKLWLKFLKMANDGIDINLLIERQPNHLFITDSCENGIGGFSLKSGRAFRFEIPSHLKGRVSNNVLEYLAEIVAIWMGILEEEVQPLDCCYSCTDNTSAIGWTFKSNFSGCISNGKDKKVDDVAQEDISPHLILSRKLASLVIDSRICLYTQHIKGILNIVADILSRDFHLNDVILTELLLYFYPTQLPRSFKISPLPEEITSFIIGILEVLPAQNHGQMLPTPSTLGAGLVGLNLSHLSDWQTTRSWIESHQDSELFSSVRSQAQSGQENLAVVTNQIWSKARLKRPWTKWLRASGQTFGLTPAMTRLGMKTRS